MELIFFGLILLVCAILWPDGMRALFAFMLKASLVAAVVIVGVILLFGMLSHANPPAPQQVKATTDTLEHRDSFVITLSDGTQVPIQGGWYRNGEMILTDEEDAERVRLFRAAHE